MTRALLVVGSAPCAHDDLAAARALFPDGEVLLVNGACTMIEDAEHMLAGHTDRAEFFAATRREAFPDRPIRIHASWARHRQRRPEPPFDKYPSVTQWHGPEVSSGATSAGKAALIGLALGYDPVVLCGCPLDGSGYSFDEAYAPYDSSCQRVGDPKMQNRRTIVRYRERMKQLAETTFRGRVFSMSGYTKQVLGAPA